MNAVYFKRQANFLVMAGILFLLRPASAQTIEEKLCGTWHYQGTEEFGVITPADSAHATEVLVMNADFRYMWTKDEKRQSGTWKYNSSLKSITFTDLETGKSNSYNLKLISTGEMIIEYQTPDLVRTRYQYRKD
jgi:hypothetical protein